MASKRKKRDDLIKLHEKHYQDLLDLNKRQILAQSMPRLQMSSLPQIAPKTPKKLTSKQRKALEQGRKILALKRSQNAQI